MDLNKAYQAAKGQLRIDISKMHFNKKEKQDIEKALNAFYSIQSSGQVDTGGLTAEEYKEILAYIEEVANLGIDEATLRVTPEETWLSQSKIDPTIKPLQLKKLRKSRGGNNIGSTTIAASKLNNIVNRIKNFKNSGKADKNFIARANAALSELEQLENINWGNGKKSVVFQNNNLPMRLNHLYSQINASALQQAIGDIGEYFSGAVLAAINAKSVQGVEKITKEFLRSLPPEAMQKIGQDKTYHYQAQYSTTNGGIKESVKATQDKVDIVVEFNGRKINLSAKNYAQIANITIFSGSLLSLLGSHQHYSNLLRSYALLQEDSEQTYQLLRKISFVKALTGGQLGRITNGNEIITTATADYVIVNHQGKRFYAWPVAEIVQKMGERVSIGKFTPEFPRNKNISIQGDRYVESVFSSHISLLTRTLR